ncbi:lectin-like protein [Primulina huaijiensis]|uniref:lectin-like protein n=1 Tax=Primulina huaijiensis TaxID=1492673 RepID=UPI003CC6EAAB
MTSFSSSRYLLALFLLDFCLKAFPTEQNKSFDVNIFGPDTNFSRLIALYGDAKAVSGSRSVQISGSGAFSAGRMIYRKPVNLVEGYPRKMVSFSVYFEFSMSGGYGDGLAFIMVPIWFPLNVFNGGSMGMFEEKKMKFLAVEFDTFKDGKYGDLNNDHVGIDVDSFVSVKVSNVSSIQLELNSGEKLQSWIDYEASSKILEVRLGRILGGKKPVDPLLSHHIDLSRMWKNEDVLLGLSSSSGNSSQKCNIYSWSFVSRTMPHWMHSEPMNPETFTEKGEEDMKVRKTRSDCAMKILAALIFGGGCGALGAFVVLFVFAIFGNRRPVTPEDLAVQPKKLEHKKLGSAIHKAIQDGKK